MSLRDLLPPQTYDDLVKQTGDCGKAISDKDGSVIMVECPTCHKKIPYSSKNPYRPFCSERCRLIDLGAWANNEMVIKGPELCDEEDGDLISDPNVARYNDKE